MREPNSKFDDLFLRPVVDSYVGNPRFLRRDWLAADLQQTLDDPDCRFVLLTAEPGAGKSTFVAQLAHENPEWILYLIRRDQQHPLLDVGARSFLLQVGFQLAALRPELFSRPELEVVVEQRVGDVATGGEVVAAEIGRILASPFYYSVLRIQQHVERTEGKVTGLRVSELALDPRAISCSDLQFMALVCPAEVLLRLEPSRQIVILVDALDEMAFQRAEESVIDWLTNCPPLPPNIRFVLTSRPVEGALGLFKARQAPFLRHLAIGAEDERVTNDMIKYIDFMTCEKVLRKAFAGVGRDIDAFAQEAVTRAEGNIGYLDALARAIEEASQEGDHEIVEALISLEQLPSRLQGLYTFLLHQLKVLAEREDVAVWDEGTNKVRYISAWSSVYKPAMGVLSAAFEAISSDSIQAWSGTPAGRDDVQRALSRLRPFLDQQRGHYEWYHTALPEFLTSVATRDSEETADLFIDGALWHGRIADFYWPMIREGWKNCDRYGLNHLAEHAAAAGVLADFVASPGYLVAAEPSSLVRVMTLHSQQLPREIVRLYQGASHHLYVSSFAERASYLAMVARQNQLNDLADQIDQLVSRRPFSVLWAHWLPDVAHITIPGHEQDIMSVAVGRLKGSPIVVSGGYDSTVRLCDAANGKPISDPLRGHHGPIHSVALGEVEGRCVVVSGGWDRTVRLWDAETAQPWRKPMIVHDGEVRSVAVGKLMGRMVLASGTSDGLVWLRNLSDNQILGEPLAHDDEIRSIAMGEFEGWPVVVTGCENGALRLWNVAAHGSDTGPLWLRQTGAGTVTETDERGTSSTFYGMAVALGMLETGPVVVSPGSNGALQVWDAASGQPVRKPWRAHDHAVNSVAVGGMEGYTVIVSGGSDGTVRLWDLASGQPVGEPMIGHDRAVYSVAVGEWMGRAVIASGGSDRTVRLWDPGTVQPPGRASVGQPGPVHSLAVSEVAGRTLVASGGSDGAVRLWEPHSGQPVGHIHKEHRLFSMAAGKHGGQTVFALGISGGMVSLWDPATGRSMRRLLMDHGNMAESVAVAELEGRPVIVALGGDGTLWLWDLPAGGTLSQPHWVRSIRSSRMAVGNLDGRTVIATAGWNDRAVKLRAAATGTAIVEPLPNHGTSVISLALADLDGRGVLVSGRDDGAIWLTDLTNAQPSCERLVEPLRGQDRYVRSVAVGKSEGKSVIVSGHDAGTVRIYSMSGREGITINVGAWVSAVAMLPDGIIVLGTSKGLMALRCSPIDHSPSLRPDIIQRSDGGGRTELAVEAESAFEMARAALFDDGLGDSDWSSPFDDGCDDSDWSGPWREPPTERYPDPQWARWYFACKRVGYGDIESARAFAEDYLVAIKGQPNLEEPAKIGFFFWSAGSPKQALEYLDRAYKAGPSPLCGIALALIADELDDSSRWDEVLEEFCSRFNNGFPK
jgi:WD40 repeat protein